MINALKFDFDFSAEKPQEVPFLDVDANCALTPVDALLVINRLTLEEPLSDQSAHAGEFPATFNTAAELGPQNLLTESDVKTLLDRASMASPSEDAIIAVVDRNGRILGVRVEDGVSQSLMSDDENLAFAIDGAVAKARTAAFFSSNAAPLPSRTIRFISQSTVTQREVESSPLHADDRYRGPGFIAPIGVGGHFPPEVPFTPQVDLFAIEHQSRDSQIHPGADRQKGTADDFALNYRFNADPDFIAPPDEKYFDDDVFADESFDYLREGAAGFFETWPESYGFVSGISPNAQSRGIATLPGGIPLFKVVTDQAGQIQMRPDKTPPLPDLNLVGGIGVFFPGEDGFATHEQGFVHGSGQSEFERNNSRRVLEAEFSAFIAASGIGLVGNSGLTPGAFVRDLSEFNQALPALNTFALPTGRIDLVGITLEIYGPTPSRQFPIPGVDRLIDVGRTLNGPGENSGQNMPVDGSGNIFLSGNAVPEQWMVTPHDAPDGSLSAYDVETIIANSIAEADITRAAIRLDIDHGFRPGARTRMVMAVADTAGNLLGVYRMPDATIFSIDVSIAKARNTAYYANANVLQEVDRIDFNGDGVLGVSQSELGGGGDTVPAGTALTNRTFRFIVEPRYPTGIEVDRSAVGQLVNDPLLGLCDQRAELCQQIGPQSILRLPGLNPVTAENLVNDHPLPFDTYASPSSTSFLAFDSFNVGRNFRDPGDATVVISGSGQPQPLANQNGVVFFPGSAPLYVNAQLVGGFGVSGDGVDQDDVVTSAGFVGFAAPEFLRVDQFVVGNVRLPYVKFNRNPLGN